MASSGRRDWASSGMPLGGPQRAGASQQAGDAVGRALDGLFGQSQAWARASRALRVWHSMSEGVVKRHSCGVSLRERRVSRELVVYVDSNAWMYEFTMRSPDVLAEWNMRCEGGDEDLRADKVTFRLATRARESGHTQTLATNDDAVELPPAQLSDDEMARVRETVSTIQDETLRRHAQDAMISIMRWKKSKR